MKQFDLFTENCIVVKSSLVCEFFFKSLVCRGKGLVSFHRCLEFRKGIDPYVKRMERKCRQAGIR